MQVNSDTDSSTSWLNVDTPDDRYKNPITSLKRLIEEENIKADVFISCGDMCDKVSFSGQKAAWNYIHDVA